LSGWKKDLSKDIHRVPKICGFARHYFKSRKHFPNKKYKKGSFFSLTSLSSPSPLHFFFLPLLHAIHQTTCYFPGPVNYSREAAKDVPLWFGRAHEDIKHLYQPRFRLASRTPDIQYTPCVTKTGLAKFLAGPLLANVIEDSVSRMTYISLEASRLANLVFLYLLQTEQQMPDLGKNGLQFFRTVFEAVCSRGDRLVPNRTSNDIVNLVRDLLYAPCRPAGRAWNDARWAHFLGFIFQSISELIF
jgi:hypothetical protein